MKISNRFALLLFLAILSILTGMSVFNQPPKNVKPTLLNYQNAFLSGKLQFPAGKPQRIVSLSPNITEILFALGAGNRIVGVTSYSDYPEEAKTKPFIGEYEAPDIEKIIAQKPDLVFASGETKENQLLILAQAGIPVAKVNPKSLPEIIAAIDLISVAVGEPERGAMLHEQFTSQMNMIELQASQLPTKRIFLEIWDVPLLTVGGKSFINDIVLRAGGKNVAAKVDADYTPSNIEALYAYNPDIYVIVSHNNENARSFINRSELANLSAVQNKQIFPIPADILTRAGPRSFQALSQLAEIMHPEINRNGEKQ